MGKNIVNVVFYMDVDKIEVGVFSKWDKLVDNNFLKNNNVFENVIIYSN